MILDWQAARRILCVRLDNLGDLLMTTPAIRALSESAPGRTITLLTSPTGALAARHIPAVHEVIEFQAPWMKPARNGGREADLEALSSIAARRFDAAVIFTVYSQNPLPAALFCHLAGIPLRLAHCRENPYHLLTDWVPETEPETRVRHEVRRQLDLVGTIGATTDDERLTFVVSRGDEERAWLKLRRAGVDPERPWIVLHPGASAPSRRYPPERFASVASELSREGLAVVVTGSRDEAPMVRNLCDAAGPVARPLAGELSLGELGAIIRHARLLISNNSGPVHIAAALGTPVVDLYALTNPQHMPWRVPNRVLYQDVSCKFCYKSACPMGHHLCLKGVEASKVVHAARELLSACDSDRLQAAA